MERRYCHKYQVLIMLCKFAMTLRELLLMMCEFTITLQNLSMMLYELLSHYKIYRWCYTNFYYITKFIDDVTKIIVDITSFYYVMKIIVVVMCFLKYITSFLMFMWLNIETNPSSRQNFRVWRKFKLAGKLQAEREEKRRTWCSCQLCSRNEMWMQVKWKETEEVVLNFFVF